MGIGGPGLQWFIIVPYRESCWSHLLLPLQPFSVPELKMFTTLSRQRESTLPHYYPLQALSLLFIPCQPQAWVCTKASTKNLWWWPFKCCTHPLSGWGLSWTSPMDSLSSLQASRQQRERCPPLCFEYSQLCSLHSSCQQVFHFQWPVANHLEETFILNQISKRKRWFKYPRVKMQTEKECDVLIVLLYGTYRGVIGQDVIIFTDNYLQTFLYTFTNFEGL